MGKGESHVGMTFASKENLFNQIDTDNNLKSFSFILLIISLWAIRQPRQMQKQLHISRLVAID